MNGASDSKKKTLEYKIFYHIYVDGLEIPRCNIVRLKNKANLKKAIERATQKVMDEMAVRMSEFKLIKGEIVLTVPEVSVIIDTIRVLKPLSW